MCTWIMHLLNTTFSHLLNIENEGSIKLAVFENFSERSYISLRLLYDVLLWQTPSHNKMSTSENTFYFLCLFKTFEQS